MGNLRYSLLVILLILSSPLCFSQTPVRVSDPTLELFGNTIYISYDILNSTIDELYDISIEVKDEDGHVIHAKALSGDIGKEVNGGNNKRIAWDLGADNVFIDAFIYVQIKANRVPPSGEESRQKVGSNSTRVSHPESTAYNRTGLILQSIALPGLGLSRVTGKPHWIRGVAGYSCLVSSFVLRNKATGTYNGIEELIYYDEINEAYDEAVKLEHTSDILLYAAAGIWITDFIWTLIGTSDLKDKPHSGQAKRVSVGSSLDPFTAAPMLSLSYKF